MQNLPLDLVTPIKNYRDIEPPSEKDQDVRELAESIKKLGMMQPVLVRPNHNNNGTGNFNYELIFGHRRLIAAKLAGLKEIPAIVKPVADEEILELQVTENLQRKDVHPLDEAVAFQSLITYRKHTIEEIALRFGKGGDYIAKRIQLNQLAPDLQKDFKANRMLLGHAILLARLTPADQAKFKKERGHYQEKYGSVQSVADYIDRQVIQKISSAPWKRDDANLYPEAGACSVCPKRSGSNALLFSDIKEDDRCFDSACFDVKAQRHFTIKLRETVETKPDILLAAGHEKPAPEVMAIAKEMKLRIYTEYTDFSTNKYGDFNKEAKAFWISGWSMGKTDKIYLKGKATGKAAEGGKEDPKTLIAGIQQRTKRAAELDQEKVYARILEAMQKHPTQKQIPNIKDTPEIPEQERIAMLYLVYDHMFYQDRDKLRKDLGTTDQPKVMYADLATMSAAKITYMIRRVFLKKHPGNNPNSIAGLIIRFMATSYGDIPIKEYEAEQKVIRDKREARAAQRIQALKAQAPAKKKAAPKKKSSPKKKK